MAFVSLTTLSFESIVVFYILKSGLWCFENSSTLIAVTIECLLGDLFKPLLTELSAIKAKKQEELNKRTNKHSGPADWCMINVIYQQVNCTINPKSRKQAPK